MAEIINGVQIADQALQYNRERRNQSQSRDRLLKEQNEAYLESLRADQEKVRRCFIDVSLNKFVNLSRQNNV